MFETDSESFVWILYILKQVRDIGFNNIEISQQGTWGLSSSTFLTYTM